MNIFRHLTNKSSVLGSSMATQAIGAIATKEITIACRAERVIIAIVIEIKAPTKLGKISQIEPTIPPAVAMLAPTVPIAATPARAAAVAFFQFSSILVSLVATA